jgi:hypothetical protein
MGGEFNYAKASQFFQFRQFGNFFFSGIGTDPTSVIQVLRILSAGGNSTTANANGNIVGAVDPTNRFDDTRVRYSRNVGNGLASMPSPQFSGFIQDAWRVRPNLTVNLGLRYEAQLMPTPETSNSALLSAVTNANLPLTTPKPTVIPDQTKQWAPRIGFAWTPGNSTKTVVRGFSGIYYAATPLLTLAAPLNNLRTPPGDLTVQLPTTNLPASLNTVYKQFQSIGIDLNTTTLDKLPILTLDQFNKIISNITQAGGAAPNPLSGLQIVTMGSKFANPRSTQFGGGVEHEVMRGFTVGANFDYVNTVHLNYNLDIDLPTPIIRPGDKSERPFFGIVSSTVIGAQHRPITQLGDSGYVQVRDPGARSLYRGFTVRGQLRRKWGQFDAFYTLAKDLDTDSTERNATFASYDNAYNLKPEYNYSAIDRRHQLAFNTVLHAPFGFQFAVFGRYLSGAPIDVSVSSIVAPAGSGLTAAQYATQVTLQGSTTGDLNQDAGNFNDRPYTAPGVSMKRNAFRNEHLLFNDLRIQRDFRFEKVTFSPSFEVFNALNLKNINLGSTTATNYGNPGINENTGAVLGPSNPTFLKLRDANGNLLLTNSPGAPRQLQFGIRFQF